jgi:hypothetical protein
LGIRCPCSGRAARPLDGAEATDRLGRLRSVRFVTVGRDTARRRAALLREREARFGTRRRSTARTGPRPGPRQRRPRRGAAQAGPASPQREGRGARCLGRATTES